PLRSASVTAAGAVPAAKSSLAAKLTVAAPTAVVFRSVDVSSEPLFAMARSRIPSPFKSPMATETGKPPVAKSCLAATEVAVAPGAVVFKSTETLLAKKLATARSGMPSPLMSPTARASGAESVPKFFRGEKLTTVDPGAVVFKSTDTRFEPTATTARSSLLSPLKSPIPTALGIATVAKSRLAAKLGTVEPGTVVFTSTDTLLELWFTTARSGKPSPLKSPTAADTGSAPVAKAWPVAKLA